MVSTRLKESNILDYPQGGLDPDIWNEKGFLRESVKEQILNKLFSFFIGQGFTNFEDWLLNIYILGSLTSYQYTRKSDLDAHVIVDSKKFTDLELPEFSTTQAFELMNEEWRKVLNDLEEEKVFGTEHSIEFYFEPQEEIEERIEKSHRHDGIYSLFKNMWVLSPRTVDLDFDPEEVFKEVLVEAEKIAKEFDLQIGEIFRELKDVNLLLEAIDTLKPEYKIIFAEKIKEKLEEIEEEIEIFVERGVQIKERRQEEYEMASPANIIFKYLARYGYLYVYRQLRKLLENDDRITENEVEKALQIIREHHSSEKILARFEEFFVKRLET